MTTIGKNKLALVRELLSDLDIDALYKLFKDNNRQWWNRGVPNQATIASEITKHLEEVYDKGACYLQNKVKTYMSVHKTSSRKALYEVLEQEGYTICSIATGRFEYNYCIEREESHFREILQVKLVPVTIESQSGKINDIYVNPSKN